MGKRRRCGGPVLPEVCLIQVLVWLPVLSLLRFKRVCRSWRDLIETSPLIHHHYFNSSSSSNKFGSFILHAAVDFPRFRYNSLLMLSSVSSESESEESDLPSCVFRYSVSYTGSNGLCGKCDYGSGCGWPRLAEDDDDDQVVDTKDGDDDQVVDTEDDDEQVVDDDDEQVLDTDDDDDDDQVVDTEDDDEQMVDDDDDDDQVVVDTECDDDQVVDNNNYLGGGGGVSNDNDGQQQEQQQLVLKVENLGFPLCYKFDKIKSPHLVKNLGFPPYYKFGKIKPHKVMAVGSCNGLICLHDSERRDVSLWNPVTGRFRILPKSSSSITIAAAGDGGVAVHRLFAFGFDNETYDYKVVLLSFFNRKMLNYEEAPMECICQVELYSSRTNSWKLLKGITSLPGSPFPYPPDSSSELFYLNGCCFFMAKLLSSEEQCIPPPRSRDRFMISLDLTNETVTPIELPSHHQYEQLYLCYLRKKIALFTKTFAYKDVYDVNDPNGSWENFCIWVFNEHRSSSVDDSWTRVHIFRIKLGLPGERNIPRGISNDGVFALLETEIHRGLGNKKKKKMKLYNLVTEEVKKNFLSCDQVLSKAYAYNPSLFWITAAAADDMVVAQTVATETADDNRSGF